MNILHLRSSGGFFGAEGVILNLARELQALGHENYIVCLRSKKNPHQELVEEAFKLNLGAQSIDYDGRIDNAAIKSLREIIQDHKIDIVHCHDYKTNMVALLASSKINIKCVTTNHLWTSETWMLRFYEFIDAILNNFFDAIVGVSADITKQVRRCLIKKDKSLTIYNGIDLNAYQVEGQEKGSLKSEFGLKEEDFLIGAVGRLSVQKGYPYLLKAFKEVVTAHPHCKLVFVGDGDERTKLDKEVSALALNENVIFAGIRRDMINVYRSLDLFVMSSIAEGLPLVLCEALAMKVPVIATRVGAIPTVVEHDETALLCEPRDSKTLAQHICTVVTDADLQQCLREKGRVLAEERLSSAAMAEQYAALYKRIL